MSSRLFGRIRSWLRDARAPTPIPDALWHETVAAQPFLDALDNAEKERLRDLATQFLADKEFTTAGGLELSDTISVSIAAQGCLPILNLGLDWYRGWIGIVVYPDEFVIPRRTEDEFGIVHEYDDVASGEAWEGGPLLVSWHDAQMAGSGYNVVIHEFAHKLDMLNGEADGIPPLPQGVSRKTWETALLTAYDDFCAQVDAADIAGEETLLDPYGSETPAEFFAVMSETFFEAPDLLRAEYPDFYELLTLFYRQDPTLRLGPHDAAAPVRVMPGDRENR